MQILLQHHAPWQMCKASQHYNRPLKWWPKSTYWVHCRESYSPLAPETNHKSKFKNSLIFSTHIKYIILLLTWTSYCVLCCMLYWHISDRSQSANDQYSTTVKGDFFTQHHQPKHWKPQTTRLDDTTTPHIKIKINEILFEKKLDTTCYPSSETQGQSVGSGEKVGWKFSSTGERAPG